MNRNVPGADEEILTRALDRAADQITRERLRPLAIPQREARARRINVAKRLAPVAAAVAVVLVVAVALTVSRGTHPAGGSSADGSPADGSLATAAGASSAGGAPKYYAEVEGNFDGSLPPGATAITVRSTATGAVVAKIPRPAVKGAPKLRPINVAAAADDRTFYALFDTDTYTAHDEYLIYRFQITPAGTATALSEVKGGAITGQKNLPNTGGFVVSPDGTRLAAAVTTTTADTSASTVAGEIVVIDLRTGAHAVWKGGMERGGLVFGIQSLSWTGDSKSVAYLGQWCAGNSLGYGIYGGFGCSDPQHPTHLGGYETVREIPVGSAGGALNDGPLLLQQSAQNKSILQAQINPAGTEIYALLEDNTSALSVATISVATGKVTGSQFIERSGILGDGYLHADSTGKYLLLWVPGSSAKTGHGWVHDGTYHALAPMVRLYSPYTWIQMTW